MNRQQDDELRIAERAAQWHEVLNRTGEGQPGDAQHAQFMAWLEESPRHVKEFLLMQAWEQEAAGFDPGRKIDVEEIAARITNIVPLKHSTAAERGANRWQILALAASLAAVAVLGWIFVSPPTYSTAIGESRTVELSDGSRIEINTQSRVRVDISARARDIQLLEGEALFKVARDANRPFRVHAGKHVIQAVGTEFTVNRRPLGTVVSVLEGAVRLLTDVPGDANANLLSAGEEARIDTRGRVEKRETPQNAPNLAAWHQRRLVFRDDALADIAAEFNRHNRNLQIVVEGDAARYKRYGGIFNADDPESIVRFVSKDGTLTVKREAGRIVIR